MYDVCTSKNSCKFYILNQHKYATFSVLRQFFWSHKILNDFFAVERFIQKQKNAAGKEMEKKADINLVDLAGRSVVFALYSLKCCSSF